VKTKFDFLFMVDVPNIGRQ